MSNLNANMLKALELSLESLALEEEYERQMKVAKQASLAYRGNVRGARHQKAFVSANIPPGRAVLANTGARSPYILGGLIKGNNRHGAGLGTWHWYPSGLTCLYPGASKSFMPPYVGPCLNTSQVMVDARPRMASFASAGHYPAITKRHVKNTKKHPAARINNKK